MFTHVAGGVLRERAVSGMVRRVMGAVWPGRFGACTAVSAEHRMFWSISGTLRYDIETYLRR